MSDPIPPTVALDGANLEAAPENPPDRRRGRPRATQPEWDRRVGVFIGSEKSRRTHIKRFHALNAQAVLAKTEGQDFGYLLDAKMVLGEILAELGRLDDERIREAAAAICEHKMKAKDAVRMIRTWRTGKTAPGESDGLAAEITRVISSYQVRHPDMTTKQVRTALQFVLDFAEDEDEPGDDLDETEPGEEQQTC